MAGNAAKLHRCAKERDAAYGAKGVIRCISKVLGCQDAFGSKLGGEPPTDTPNLVAWEFGENFRRILRQEKNTVRLLLGEMVGDLREGLCRRKTDAAWNSHPAQYLRPKPFAVSDILFFPISLLFPIPSSLFFKFLV